MAGLMIRRNLLGHLKPAAGASAGGGAAALYIDAQIWALALQAQQAAPSMPRPRRSVGQRREGQVPQLALVLGQEGAQRIKAWVNQLGAMGST